MKSFLILLSILLIFGITTGYARYVSVGAGSYSLELPLGVRKPQDQIYRVPELTGPMPTNDWWTSAASTRFSGNLFAHPLAFLATSLGLKVGYPDRWEFDETILPSGFPNGKAATPFTADFTVGTGDAFLWALVSNYSDWSVTLRFVTEEGSFFEAILTQGSPYVFFYTSAPRVEFSFTETPSIKKQEGGLGLSVGNHHYGFFFPEGSTWTYEKNRMNVELNDANFFSLALLPESTQEMFETFLHYAFSFITTTEISWNYMAEESIVETTYKVHTTAVEGEAQGTIMALYPHQWRYLHQGSTLPGSYVSARGTMKLLSGCEFVTRLSYPGILPFLPETPAVDKERLLGLLEEIYFDLYLIRAGLDRSRGGFDTYWVGKNLGRLQALIPLALQAGDEETADYVFTVMKERLERWFTAIDEQGIKRSSLFYYDDNWGTLIGYPANYGSDTDINDHHFHYGYFIQAAAEILRHDLAWAKEYGEMVELLLRDIASPMRDDPMFPFLRHFSPYAGHSWASGLGYADHVDFFMGNNHESSSEALHAWASIILWASHQEDEELLELGIFLFTQELHAVYAYWFDVYGENFPPSWNYNYAAKIWGGGLKYNTWWTQNREEIHGINWMPFTGASLYLGRYKDYVRANYDLLVRETPWVPFRNWEEFIYQWLVFADPKEALSQFEERVELYTPEFGTTKAFTYHWLYTLAHLGSPDPSVWADTPLYSVLVKEGQRSYIAYNPRSHPITVSFSDGTSFEVPPYSMKRK